MYVYVSKCCMYIHTHTPAVKSIGAPLPRPAIFRKSFTRQLVKQSAYVYSLTSINLTFYIYCYKTRFHMSIAIYPKFERTIKNALKRSSLSTYILDKYRMFKKISVRYANMIKSNIMMREHFTQGWAILWEVKIYWLLRNELNRKLIN